MHKKLAQIQQKIDRIKEELQGIDEMRPGSLTRQYQKPAKKLGGYFQLSYTYQMRSRTEYVRPEFVDEVKQQIQTFKRFKKLVQTWTDLAIAHAKLKMKIAKGEAG
jgi:hypothetical protein